MTINNPFRPGSTEGYLNQLELYSNNLLASKLNDEQTKILKQMMAVINKLKLQQSLRRYNEIK